MSDSTDGLRGDAARRCEALRERLTAHAVHGDLDTSARAELRAEIVALIRMADAEAHAWQAVADAARALPELWKRLPDVAAASPSVAVRGAAIATAPTSARSDHLGASTFLAKGWSAFAAADFATAEAAFDRALALAPDELEAVALVAWARAARGAADDALLAAQRVLVANARGAAASLARVAVGRVCLTKQIVGEAIEHLSRVVRDGDDRRATLYATFYLGVAYQRREMYDDSAAFLRRALALGPNLVEARYELGCTLWRAGAREAACVEWRIGASGTFSPWAARCRERLDASEAAVAAGA